MAKWKKSSFCADGTCVEVAWDGDEVLMRDSKNLDQPPLRFKQATWVEFTGRITKGEFGQN